MMRALLLACALAVAAARDDAATVRTLEDRLKKLDGHESQMSSAEKSKLTAMRQRLSALKRSMGDEDAPQSLERTPSRHQIEAAEEEPAHELERDAASPAALESRYRKLKAKVDSTPELKDDAEVMSTLRSVEKKLKAASGGASHASHAAKAAPASLERTASDGRTVREIIRHAEEHLGAMEASGSSAERARARAAKKQFADLSATLGKSSDASAVSRALERVRGAVAEMNDPSGAEIAEAPRAKYAASLERTEEEDEVPELEEEEEEEADLERGGDARVGAVVKKLEAAVNTLKAKPDALAKSPELQQLLKRTRAHVADLEANLGVDGAARPPAGADMESGMEVRRHPPPSPSPRLPSSSPPHPSAAGAPRSDRRARPRPPRKGGGEPRTRRRPEARRRRRLGEAPPLRSPRRARARHWHEGVAEAVVEVEGAVVGGGARAAADVAAVGAVGAPLEGEVDAQGEVGAQEPRRPRGDGGDLSTRLGKAVGIRNGKREGGWGAERRGPSCADALTKVGSR